jgi:hypothetical protein
MHSSFRVSTALLASAFALGCAEPQSPTVAGSNWETAGQAATMPWARAEGSLVTRPLSGRCITSLTRISSTPPIEVERDEYTCRISHLGLTHAVVTQIVDLTTGATTNSGVWVAANGDELGSAFTGSVQITFTGPTTATVSFAGTQEFSAGTGRFATASGTAHLAGSAQLNLVTGAATGEFTLEGTLTY